MAGRYARPIHREPPGPQISAAPTGYSAMHKRRASQTALCTLRLATASPIRCSSNRPAAGGTATYDRSSKSAPTSVTPSFTDPARKAW